LIAKEEAMASIAQQDLETVTSSARYGEAASRPPPDCSIPT
jgi:hypothetical protein